MTNVIDLFPRAGDQPDVEQYCCADCGGDSFAWMRSSDYENIQVMQCIVCEQCYGVIGVALEDVEFTFEH